MSSRNTFLYSITASFLTASLFASVANAQADQYRRPKPAASPAPATGSKGTAAPAAAADEKSDKLDISDLEKKYWAPKDTDFSVVQNRTYTKAERFAFSLLTGPLVNDPFNEGFNNTAKLNYYFDERYGVELTYIGSNISDSKDIKNFLELSGGGVRPDNNQEENYIAVGFNWVPIYAKVSLLGKRILYFDMQVTPHVGMSTYSQQSDPSDTTTNGNKESSFTFGLDVTQYFFMSKNLALRFDLHNRWYKQDVLNWDTGVKIRDRTTNTTMFLFGLTYFH